MDFQSPNIFFKYAYSTEKLCLLISVALQTVKKSVPCCCQISTIWLYLNELFQHVSFEWPSCKRFLLCTEDGSGAQPTQLLVFTPEFCSDFGYQFQETVNWGGGVWECILQMGMTTFCSLPCLSYLWWAYIYTIPIKIWAKCWNWSLK